MFKLTKVSIKEGHTSNVPVGTSRIGDVMLMDRDGWRRHTEDLDSVKPGDHVFILTGLPATNFIRTSPVKAIREHPDKLFTLILTTETSEYTLEKLLDEQEDD